MAKKKDKRLNNINWLIGVLNDAKERGIKNFSFHEGSGMHPHCPQIYEVGVSNLTGVTIYLESSKWDEDQKEKQKKEDQEELNLKKHKRMIEIWNNSPASVHQMFLTTVLKHFSTQFMLTKEQSKELKMCLEIKKKK